MTRIAVLGANGQVGAEVCLLLRNQPDVELIPVCRNPRSSSYLRYHGMACRHGLPADADQARELFAGADVILDFALAQGLPRDTRRIHEAMIRNSFRCAPAGSQAALQVGRLASRKPPLCIAAPKPSLFGSPGSSTFSATTDRPAISERRPVLRAAKLMVGEAVSDRD